MRVTIHAVARRDHWPFALADAPGAARPLDPQHARRRDARPHAAARASAARAAGRDADDHAQGARCARRQAARARRRPVDRPRARAAVRHLGAPPRRPLRGRGGLARPAAAARARGRGGAARRAAISRASVPRRARTSSPTPASRSARWRPRCSAWRCGRSASEAGDELLDVPRAPLPDPDTPAPVRFLPTWDATLLVHARRARILPEEHRPKIFHVRNPHSLPTFLVDGAVAGSWRHRDGAIELEPFEPLDDGDTSRAARRGRPPRRVSCLSGRSRGSESFGSGDAQLV